jgi:hypothetical protein
MKGMGQMNNGYSLKELKIEIEDKRRKLNELVVSSIDKDEVLKFSIELDRLIGKYYDVELNKKRADG